MRIEFDNGLRRTVRVDEENLFGGSYVRVVNAADRREMNAFVSKPDGERMALVVGGPEFRLFVSAATGLCFTMQLLPHVVPEQRERIEDQAARYLKTMTDHAGRIADARAWLDDHNRD